MAKCGDDRERDSIIALVRCIFEASIQKYAKIEPCHRIGSTDKLKIGDILDGFFIEEGINELEEEIIDNPQLVLTKFGINELNEFYQLEKLVFEVWRTAGNLRGFNKGALLEVTHNPGDIFELRNEILEKSIEIYDERYDFNLEAPFTAKGTIYELVEEKDSLWSFIPIYNVSKINTKQCIENDIKLFSDMDVTISQDIISNFLVLPINLRNYYKSNLFYSKEFEESNDVNIESVMAILVGILINARDNWKNPVKLIKYYQRGYEGPYRKEDIYNMLKSIYQFILNFLD